MSKHLFKKLVWSVVVVAVVAGAVCGALWLINNRKPSIAETDNPTDEQFEQYFAEYAEMITNYDSENLLIVVSEGRPETYGAVDVVEAPRQTYYLMYESAEVRDEAYSKLEQDNLISVEKNSKMELLGYNSWGITAMGLDEAREAIGYGNNEVKVAVIDTGLDMDVFRRKFPDMKVEFYDVETGSSYSGMVDYNGHGTHVAGTIAEGMPQNGRLLVLRVTQGSSSQMDVSDVNVALNRANYEGARVINMSLGSDDYIESQKRILDNLAEYNRVVVAAAGNDGNHTVMYPAAYDSTIAVSAVNQDKTLADYSNYGPEIDFAAPGTMVKSINGVRSGTSMATPHVAAAVATLKSFDLSLSLQETNTLLRQHAQDLGDPGKDDEFGYGFIDLSGAEYCESGGYCDEYGVFAVEAPVFTRMEIDDVTLTPRNYYTISNLMLTEVKLYTDETNYVTKLLQDTEDLTITGYDPLAGGAQNVTISCEGFSKTVSVTNPDDYESGWEYQLDGSGQVLLTNYYDVRDEDDEIYSTSLEKLYVPKQIDGRNVVELSEEQKTIEYDDGGSFTRTYTVFERSNYAKDRLKEVYLPDTLTVIRDRTFYSFRNLEKVVMAAGGVRLGDWAFDYAEHLRIVEGNIIEMGKNVFSDNYSLESVTLAEGLTAIPSNAFSGCYSLKEIIIPSTVTTLDSYAFYNARSLERVVFNGNNVITVGSSAFDGARSLSSITLPEGLKRISGKAFSGTKLTSVQIPASVENIEDGAFSNNDKFARITVAAGNQKYYTVDDEVLMYDEYSRKYLVVGTRSLAIPEGTTDIESRAFYGFSSAVGVLVLPDSLTWIGREAFFGCTGLTDVVIPRLDRFSRLERVFEKEKQMSYSSTTDVPMDVKLWVYNNDTAYDYATNKGFNYQTIDASYARIVEPFEPGGTLSDEMEVEFYQDYGTRIGGVFTNYTGINGYKSTKTVGELVNTEYAGEVERFRLGDTYFNATYTYYTDKEATMRVAVTVEGEYPEYTVPTGITGKLNTQLYDVELPEGFSWMDSAYLYQLGEFTYMAMYTPEDTTSYAPIENVPITITVVPGRTKLPDPVITVDSKVYDGDWSIDPSLIHVTVEGLDADDYSVYGNTGSLEVGTTWANVYVNLKYDVSLEYGIGDNYEILPATPELEVEDKTGGAAEYEVEADGIVVTADKACTVVITYDEGASYTRVLAVAVEGEENTYKFEFEINEDVEVMMALNGDGNLDGRVSSADSNVVNRSLIGHSLPLYQALTNLEKALLDLNGDNRVSSADSNIINRSLIGHSLPLYQPIGW